MSSAQGRFTSPDPLGNFVADLRNPQSWNLYSYVWNNPLVNIDPTGLTCVSVSHPDGSTGQADDGDGKGCSDAGVVASPIKHGLKDDKPVVTSKDITPQQANVYGGPNAAAQEVREIVGQFLTGTAPKQVVYGPDDPFTQSFKQSAGMDAIVGGIKGSCKTQGRVFVGSGEAFVNTLIDGILGGQGFGTPEAQLGAFDSSFTRSGGQVNIQVYNPISLNSLAYHATGPIGVRNPASGPLSTVNQTLQLSIADPCR